MLESASSSDPFSSNAVSKEELINVAVDTISL